MAPIAALEKILDGWRLWFRLRRSWTWMTRGLAGGLALSMLFSLFAVRKGYLLREEYVFIIVTAATMGALVGGIVAFAWPLPPLRAARTFDRVFGLRERTSTALELAHSPRLPLPAAELVQKQMDDALAAARRVKPREQLPLQFHWREIAAAALLAAGVILVWARGGPFFQAAYQERAVQATIQQQVKQIETLRSQIEADPGLTPEQRQALTRPLEEALEKLRSSKSMEQAISALHEAEEQLRSLYSSEAGASALEKASGLNEAGNGLSQQDGSPLQSFGERLATGEYLEAAQKLQNIDPASLSGEEAAALAGQLEETAAALKSTDPELAQHLREAAEAIRRGDMAAAQQALQQAGQTLGQAGQQIHQAQVAGQAAAQAGQGQQRILQAGRSAQSQQPGGQGQADGQGQGSGQGSSSQPDGNAGGGAGRGEGGGNSDQGSEAGDNPIQPDNGPGDAGERPYEQIYAPERLGELNSAGSEVAVPGSSQPGDQVLGQGNTAPGSPGDSRVPYVEVLPFYEEAYRQAIESGDVPVFLRDLVRKYFSSLQP